MSITVSDLAKDKGFTVKFLEGFGLKNFNGGVLIPYQLPDGSPAPRQRLRTALKAKEGSFWTQGKDGLIPYGLQDLPKIREQKELYLTEGESDRWTLKFYDYPVLGIPGADLVGVLKAEPLEGIERIYAIQEPDKGGKEFIKKLGERLQELKWPGQARAIDFCAACGCKDPNDLHKKDPVKFKETLNAAMTNSWDYPPFYDGSLGPEPPRPLQKEIPPADLFPIEALGPILAPAARVIQEAIQAPAAICANSVLAAAALAAQPFIDVEIDGRTLPISENFLTVGISGERKSAVDTLALFVHRKREKERMNKYEQSIIEWNRETEIFQKSKDEALSSKSKGRDSKREALKSLGEPPKKPRIPLFLLQEPSYEGLIKLLEAGSPSCGLYSDEGGRFLAGYAMSEENQIKTAAGLSELWDGKSVTRVRGKDGASLLSGRRLSIHIMCQPNVAGLLLCNNGLAEQGLLSRFLVTFPESACGKRLYRSVNPYIVPELRDYFDRVEEILETDFPVDEDSEVELKPRRLTLSTEAKKIWIAFHDQVEVQLAPEGIFASVRAMANKAPEHVLRLAAIIEYFHDTSCTKISAQLMANATILVGHYLNEALRLYQYGQIDPEIEIAKELLEWLQKRGNEKFSLVEVYRYGPNSIREAKTARQILAILEEHGWILPLPEGTEFEGKHRREAWRLVK